jgi:hypothetical protein
MKDLIRSERLSFRGVAMIGTAIGAVAVGAFAIGALAIGRLAIRRVVVEIAELTRDTSRTLREEGLQGPLVLPHTRRRGIVKSCV